MSFLIATLLTIAVISRPIACNYDCICHYDVEQAVYSAPDPLSAPLGFLYEFDCKAIDAAQSHPEWWTIFYDHRTGYVPTGDKIIEQTCPGDIPPDDILTTKQTPKQSGHQSTIFSTPKSSVTDTLYSKQTSGYSTSPGTNSDLSTKSSASTLSRSTKISTSRPMLSTILSSHQGFVTSTLYHQHTGSHNTSPGTKSYFTHMSSISTVSRTTKTLTSRPVSSTTLSSPQNFVTGTLYHQNIASSSISPKTKSYFTTTSSTSSPRSATSSTSVHLSPTVNGTSTWNSLSSLKTNLSFVKSSATSIQSSAQTMVESKRTSLSHALFNITKSLGTKAEIASSRTTIPSLLFNVTSSAPTKTVISSKRTVIPSVLFNVTSTSLSKTVVASSRTTIPLILSNVTSTLPIRTVVVSSKTPISSILFNVTSRLPTTTVKVVASNRTTLPPIQSKETIRFSTKVKVTSNSKTLMTSLFNTTTKTGNTTKSSTTATPLNHFNATKGLSSKIKIPSERTTMPSVQFNTTTMLLSSKTRITDNTHHTMFNSSTYVPAKNVTTKLFNEMTSTTTRQSNISIKVNWTTVPTQTEASKPSIPSAITSSSMTDTSVQLNTVVSSTSSKQNHTIKNEVSYSTTSVRRGPSVTATNKVYSTTLTTPTVIRSTTDKWSVEMCPYLMLSRNKYNGSLDHPYPLVRRVGQHCYEFNAKLENWYSARSICRQKGGDLVVLDTETTEIILLSMLRELQFDGEVWIGLTDIDTEGIWTWVNGVRYRYEHWDSLSNGDPAYNVRRNCAVMNTVTGQWKKTVCRGFLLEMPRHYFICQYSI